MKYSLVDNAKSEPFKGGKGNCIRCGQETIAKCGTRKVHHWAHTSLINCDTWWENETEWHRKWKNYFPKEWQEIVHIDEITGEKHIADVKTSKGLIIEFQNSPISFEELNSREVFYKKMIWIINGKSFKSNFHILHALPNPKAEFVKDIAFMDRKKDHEGKLFFRYSENEENAIMVLVRSVNDLKDEINSNYIGHHIYDWVRPRTVWLNSNCRVFIDFEDDGIWELQTYDKRGLRSVRKYSKEHFIKRAKE
ncbi:MAG: hypothetical protein IPH98_11300 [Saprospiraceae bacterium]|nr:hypothetical protein [Candidatus Defluviibacterium haderslevense]